MTYSTMLLIQVAARVNVASVPAAGAAATRVAGAGKFPQVARMSQLDGTDQPTSSRGASKGISCVTNRTTRSLGSEAATRRRMSLKNAWWS